MKKFLLAILFFTLIFSCGSNEITDDNFTDLIDSDNIPVMTFEEIEFDFGTIIEGAVVKRRFNFTNTGDGPLLISSIGKSCGCTIPESWSRDQIKVGEKGYIDVVFNSEGFPGTTDKRLYVVANTFPTDNVIRLTGTVIGPDKQ